MPDPFITHTTWRRSANRFIINDLVTNPNSVVFAVTGCVEEKTYTGGTSLGGRIYHGGTPNSDLRNIVKLERLQNGIVIDTWFLNYSVAPVDYVVGLTGATFTATSVANGTEFILTVDNYDGTQFSGDIFGAPIDGVWLSQWVQVEYSPQVVTTLGGGVTGFIWSGMSENVLTNKAEK